MSRKPQTRFFVSLWNYLTKVRPAEKNAVTECVGKDARGNKYYIKLADPSKNVKEARWIIPSDKVTAEFYDKLDMDIPQEWDAWLRRRRKEPPTEEEIEKNRLMKLKVQQRVQELNRKEQMENVGQDTMETTSISKDISSDQNTGEFPIYEDMEIKPGVLPKHRATKR